MVYYKKMAPYLPAAHLSTAAIGSARMNVDSRIRIRRFSATRTAHSLKQWIGFMAILVWTASTVFAAAPAGDTSSTATGGGQLILGEATVAEIVKNGVPSNSAVAFSISLGRIYCFTDFVEVGAKTVIYHNWYHRDEKRASVKLALRPPRWATFSSVVLRNSDKGPWQVEVTTEDGSVLQILRFSVID